MIAGGLRGIDEALVLPGRLRAATPTTSDAPRMPTSLDGGSRAASTEARWRASAFGDDVVDHYVHAARVELEAFRSTVTDWERVRGFERL